MTVSSAAGLLALLEEHNDDIKRYALSNLDKVVHEYWFQISGSIASVEALYEDDEFSHRELAALVASKVFYHLGELDDALNYALGAGSLFDVTEQSEYVQTLVARCLDQYFELRVKQVEQKEEVTIDGRLTAIVERMLDKCCVDGQFEQAVGVALEGRRLDKLKEVVMRSPDITRTLKYALRVCQELVINKAFRQQVLRLLVQVYEGAPSPDLVDIAQCLMFLDEPKEVATILDRLLQGSADDELLAAQVCFDLVENEVQSFLLRVQAHLDELAPKAPAASVAAAAAPAGGDAMETDAPAAPAAPAVAEPPAEVPEHVARYAAKLRKLKDILSGKTPIGLYLDFLYRHNHADLQILRNIKGAIDARNSVTHSATILANALMHAGTTVDTFLRDNLDWLSRATNWAKFSATAGLGVIHKGHLTQGRALMAPYLPRGGNHTGSPYSEGGALYALGLIYANHGSEVRGFLLEALRGCSNEVTQHGGCLGLGLASLGSEDEDVVEDIKNVLYTDSAVAGEAAGIGLGLVLAGSSRPSERASDMLAYAHDTQHEKIIRGIALGLAVMQYGREEGADALIEQLTLDQDPILRYGGMYAIGLAYRGTGNNAAVQKLLHFAVSDVSDDVRRAAVLCLGFLLMGNPEQCPKIVGLLAESFNPHMRYGAAMAVGMACAGSGLREAVALLEPLTSDSVDFVRQGALIAMALVLVQQPEARLEKFRKRLDKSIANKHEEVMARMGAIMAAGILDAGGRNVTIGLRSRSGYFRRTAVIGLAVFTQYWYWYPLSFFLSLALTPTALIGLNADMAMPVLSVSVGTKPSTHAYLPPLTAEKKEEVAKVPTAILSTTAKARERQKKKDAEKAKDGSGAAPMAADEPKVADAAAATGQGAEAMDTDGAPGADGDKGKDKAGEGKVKEVEEERYSAENPARVVPAQARVTSLSTGGRWVPVKAAGAAGLSGIIVLRDTQPGEPVELVAAHAATAPAAAAPAAGAAAAPAAAAPEASAPAAPTAPAPPAADDDDEPPPPAPFEYRPPQ